jgi:hypothetical protein
VCAWPKIPQAHTHAPSLCFEVDQVSNQVLVLQLIEGSMTHDGMEDGLIMSESDARRMELLLEQPDVQKKELEAGISVQLFKTKFVCPMPRISLRVLDADMFKQGCHPACLRRALLTLFLSDSDQLHQHVKQLVEEKLCTPECVQLVQQSGAPHSKHISLLQYITRQCLKNNDERFIYAYIYT